MMRKLKVGPGLGLTQHLEDVVPSRMAKQASANRMMVRAVFIVYIQQRCLYAMASKCACGSCANQGRSNIWEGKRSLEAGSDLELFLLSVRNVDAVATCYSRVPDPDEKSQRQRTHSELLSVSTTS